MTPVGRPMLRPSGGRRRRLAVVPLAIGLLVSLWLLWVDAEPARQSGFCANPTLAFAATSQLEGRPAPELLSLVSDEDLSRLQVRTPANLRRAAGVVVRDGPAYRSARRRAEHQGSAVPTMSKTLERDFDQFLSGYAKRCLTADYARP